MGGIPHRLLAQNLKNFSTLILFQNLPHKFNEMIEEIGTFLDFRGKSEKNSFRLEEIRG